MTIDFQSRTPTVTQPFFGRTQLKEKKKKKNRGARGFVLMFKGAKEVRSKGPE